MTASEWATNYYVNPSITRVSLLHQYIRMAHAMTSFTSRHCIYVDMWVWLDCGACACAHFSSFAVTPGLSRRMCGRPDDTRAGACSCTMWVERKTTVRQTASRQHIEKSAWASAAQHSTKPLWPVWDGYHRQRGCGAGCNLSYIALLPRSRSSYCYFLNRTNHAGLHVLALLPRSLYVCYFLN